MLEWLHKMVGNWGWAIILLTILIKLVFYPLSVASYRSMAHMRKMQPRMAALKERFGDDKQKLNQAMMELYKTEKINPLGGCLPILVQIPVFIALYWVLLESVEMRQAPLALWIKDLSAPDPYYVLPVLMGADHARAAVAEPAAGRSAAEETHVRPAGGVHRHVPVLPFRPGAVLGGAEYSVGRAAVADQSRDRGQEVAGATGAWAA